MHHCMGQMAADAGLGEQFSAVPSVCPRFPVASAAPQLHSFVPHGTNGVGLPVFVRPASLPQTEARYRVACARSRQKRGPPSFPV
jgi:hypothetical protein